ncbi:Helix-turn-helix domain protein [Mycolicibacterium conceptionense]|uniref:Helix-turn-helix domain protein n=1 Tax=Mycolicibacterium conceptionense TaxID=451644 RepID=A0A0U1DTM4_9MYCO|nr:helix-turn-helix domain-containing protein [Mycolicibacterium conceptionense]ORV29064.1 hypothetical protein AWB98_06650 [Mycolicibacterium conceptionense]CQD21608.1 Helix-turn-helix domain protein [Mycolicibacterium conceptionense]
MIEIEGLVLEPSDAEALQIALERYERKVARDGARLSRQLARIKMDLAAFVSRAGSRVDTTTRPAHGTGCDPDGELFIDTAEAAKMLGITEDAVRRRCRSGIFVNVAKRVRGRWMVPSADVEAVMRNV